MNSETVNEWTTSIHHYSKHEWDDKKMKNVREKINRRFTFFLKAWTKRRREMEEIKCHWQHLMFYQLMNFLLCAIERCLVSRQSCKNENEEKHQANKQNKKNMNNNNNQNLQIPYSHRTIMQSNSIVIATHYFIYSFQLYR